MKRAAMTILVFLFFTAIPCLAETDVFMPVWAALESNLPNVALLELQKMKDAERQKLVYWYYLGTSYRRLGRNADAVESFNKGLSLGRNGGSLNGLGLTYLSMGEHALAEEFISKAIATDPMNGRYHYGLGTVYMAKGEQEKAVNEFVTSYKLSRSRDALRQLAVSSGLKGDYEKAKSLLMVEYPLHEVYSILGSIYESGGKPEMAKEMRKMSLIAGGKQGGAETEGLP